MARRASLLGDALEPCTALYPTSDSSQSPPRLLLQSSITLKTPPQSDYPTDKDGDISLTIPSQDTPPTASTSFSQVQPLQKRFDHFQSHTRSHYRPHLHEQQRHSDISGDDTPAAHTVQTSVILRTTTLVPSSPLLKSTVITSRASDEVSHHHSQSEPPIQADPTSPYYSFQDTRLIPNPIIRIYMATNANPRMFSVQNISPDTLSLLLSVFIHIVCSFKGGN